MEIFKRIAKRELQRLAQHYPVAVINGPRQSGKTTLCKQVFPAYHYVDMDDVSLREQILTAPKDFLSQFHQGLIIDEAQHCPDLFPYIKVVVDELPECHFILTGSSNFALMAKVTESLAGRATTLTLLPLSLTELGDKKQSSTDLLMINGGYPAVWAKGIPAMDVSRNYYNTYIERDVRQLLNVRDIVKFQTFIKLCAGRIGTEWNASSLSNATGLSVPTINEWLSVLEASYVLFRLPPFFKNIGKRLVKSPKLYFYDTGLVSFLLGIENETELVTHPLRGMIFENMVVLEFFKHRFNHGKSPNFYFYRDKSQHEVDLIEEKGTKLLAYEIKSAKAFTKGFVKNLDYFRYVVGDQVVSTQVIYDGEHNTHSTENGVLNFRDISFSN